MKEGLYVYGKQRQDGSKPRFTSLMCPERDSTKDRQCRQDSTKVDGVEYQIGPEQKVAVSRIKRQLKDAAT